MRIVWNQKALDSLDDNITFLKKRWTKREVYNFLGRVAKTINILEHHPELGTIFDLKPILRKIKVTSQITLFYEIDGDTIHLHLFWLNFKDPSGLQVLFS